MELKIHGAAKEVGRSAIQLTTNDHKILLDAGIKLAQETSYPLNMDDLTDTDVVFLTHAHLDHSGCLPLLRSHGMHCPVITNSVTKALTRILFKDAYKVEKINRRYVNYSKDDITETLADMQNVKYRKEYGFHELRYQYYDAGHIPGSSMILLEADGKRILYTGDFNTNESLLLNPADVDIPPGIDVLITESTYGDREHLNRKKQREDFIQSIKATIARGGSVIVPVFAVGRAQEILLMLDQHDFGVPVYLDGMAKRVTEQMLAKPKFIKDVNLLKKAIQKVKVVKGFRERKNFIKQQGIFVTTSGMLEGGPVLDYIAGLWENELNSILLTGYQAEYTNGRLLVEEGNVFLDGWKVNVKAEVKHYDFSAHVGRTGLHEFITKIDPKKLVTVHGDSSAMKELAEWAESRGIESCAPALGDKIII